VPARQAPPELDFSTDASRPLWEKFVMASLRDITSSDAPDQPQPARPPGASGAAGARPAVEAQDDGAPYILDAERHEILSLEDITAEIKAGLIHFITAVKNTALFPENSQIRIDALAKIHHWFEEFLDEQESFKLFVDPDSLLFQGQVVYQDKSGEQSLIFPLFRDGIQWIEFHEGLTADELTTFIIFLNRYRMLREEDEDDIVTMMWKAEFEFIKYKTANEFWDIDPITEISALKVGSRDGNAAGFLTATGLADQNASADAPAGVRALVAHLNDASPGRGQSQGASLSRQLKPSSAPASYSAERSSDDPALFKLMQLDDDDWRELKALVDEETKPKTLAEGLAPALELLRRLRNVAQCEPTLELLVSGVKFGLAEGRFSEVMELCRGVSALADELGDRLSGLFEDFRRRLGSEDVLEGLAACQTPEEKSPADLAALAAELDAFLALLPPSSAKAIVVAASSAQGLARDRLLRSLCGLDEAQQTPELGAFLNTVLTPDALLALIGHLKAQAAGLGLLTALSRNVSLPVREAASVTVLEREPERIATMRHLLKEPNPSLNRQVYFFLGAKRSRPVENALLSYLRSVHETKSILPPDAVLNGWRALGQAAASSKTTEFASKVLLKKNLRSLFGLSSDQEKIHLTGAALALLLMDRRQVFERAARSSFKDLRRACREAEAEAARLTRVSRPHSPKAGDQDAPHAAP
jgi:hypothetical protein